MNESEDAGTTAVVECAKLTTDEETPRIERGVEGNSTSSADD